MAIPAKDDLGYFIEGMNQEDCEKVLQMFYNIPIFDENYEPTRPLTYDDLVKGATHAMIEDINKRRVVCDICGASAKDIMEASNAGFWPTSWLNEWEQGPSPICGECVEKFFHLFEDEPSIRNPGEFLC